MRERGTLGGAVRKALQKGTITFWFLFRSFIKGHETTTHHQSQGLSLTQRAQGQAKGGTHHMLLRLCFLPFQIQTCSIQNPSGVYSVQRGDRQGWEHFFRGWSTEVAPPKSRAFAQERQMKGGALPFSRAQVFSCKTHC